MIKTDLKNEKLNLSLKAANSADQDLCARVSDFGFYYFYFFRVR